MCTESSKSRNQTDFNILHLTNYTRVAVVFLLLFLQLQASILATFFNEMTITIFYRIQNETSISTQALLSSMMDTLAHRLLSLSLSLACSLCTQLMVRWIFQRIEQFRNCVLAAVIVPLLYSLIHSFEFKIEYWFGLVLVVINRKKI